jgi:hypothetical protein
MREVLVMSVYLSIYSRIWLKLLFLTEWIWSFVFIGTK